jgi:CHASE2 domain-containing sensor protein
LIGSIASSEGDLWHTPLHVECPGVVIHGVIFNAIVTGKFWRTWPAWLNLTAIFCLGLATTAVVTWMPARKALAVTVVLGLGYLGVNGAVLFGIWRTVADAAGPIVVIVGVCLASGFIRVLSSGGRLQPGVMFASRRSRGL